jgi:hypothetical protein
MRKLEIVEEIKRDFEKIDRIIAAISDKIDEFHFYDKQMSLAEFKAAVENGSMSENTVFSLDLDGYDDIVWQFSGTSKLSDEYSQLVDFENLTILHVETRSVRINIL